MSIIEKNVALKFTANDHLDEARVLTQLPLIADNPDQAGTPGDDNRGAGVFPAAGKELRFLDLNLLKVYSLEVLEWIRADANLDRIPVVVPTWSKPRSAKSGAAPAGPESYTRITLAPGRFLSILEGREPAWFEIRVEASGKS